MDHQSPPAKKFKNNDLDTSPVFFTGLSKKSGNFQSATKLCRLCSRNLNDNNRGDLCFYCSDETTSQNYSSTHVSPSCSNSSSNKRKADFDSPLPRPNLNSPLENDLVNSSIESLRNTDIKSVKALLDSVQSPNRETDNFKLKGSYKNQLENRSRVSPYSLSPSPRQHSNHNAPGPSYYTPNSNGMISHYNGSHALSLPDANVGPYTSLSREMWEVFHANKQTEEIKTQKFELRGALQSLLGRLGGCRLYVVGSSMTGLGTNSSDIDMCLMLRDEEMDQKKEAMIILRNIQKQLFSCKFVRHIRLIPAKVPILRFIDVVSGVEVDLNINNSTGIRNTQLLLSYARIDERVAPMVILVKMWARHYDINDASRNTLSSYSIVLMVIHYLQYKCQPPVVPCLQKLQPDKYLVNTSVRIISLYEDLPYFKSENVQDLGDLFVGFLEYYGNEFDFQSVISVRLGEIISKEVVMRYPSPKNGRRSWQHVCIEEPFDRTNTARSVYNKNMFDKILAAFRHSWLRITENPEWDFLLS